MPAVTARASTTAVPAIFAGAIPPTPWRQSPRRRRVGVAPTPPAAIPNVTSAERSPPPASPVPGRMWRASNYPVPATSAGAIPADADTSASTIVASAILSDVTAPSTIFDVATDASPNLPAVTEPGPSSTRSPPDRRVRGPDATRGNRQRAVLGQVTAASQPSTGDDSPVARHVTGWPLNTCRPGDRQSPARPRWTQDCSSS